MALAREHLDAASVSELAQILGEQGVPVAEGLAPSTGSQLSVVLSVLDRTGQEIPMSQTVRVQYEWGVIEWLAGAEVGNSGEMSVARVTLPAGNETDLHAHDNCEESVYVVQGTVECSVGGVAAKLGPRDLAIVMRGEVHHIRNSSSEPAELLLSYSSARREFRVVVDDCLR